jgi:hypothetical protein
MKIAKAPEPCSRLAIEQGCICHLPRDATVISIANKTIERGKPCPLHGDIPDGRAIWRNERWERL